MNILFLGDSITDCDHSFTEDDLGYGYVKKLTLLPGVTATNGGTDGFTFPDMLRKWRRMYSRNTYDCVVMTCGINDVAVIADLEKAGRHKDASVFLDESMTALRTLLHELSDSGILLLEPFLFPIPQARTLWLPALQKVRDQIQKTIADFNERQTSLSETISSYSSTAFRVRYVPTQSALDDLASRIGLSAVTSDGVHLTNKGHECLAKLVADAFKLK